MQHQAPYYSATATTIPVLVVAIVVQLGIVTQSSKSGRWGKVKWPNFVGAILLAATASGGTVGEWASLHALRYYATSFDYRAVLVSLVGLSGVFLASLLLSAAIQKTSAALLTGVVTITVTAIVVYWAWTAGG